MTKKKDKPDATVGRGNIIGDQMDYIDFVAKYHGDESFKKAADSDAAETLRSEGLAVPEGVKVNLLASDAKVMHLVLPPLSGKKPKK